MACIKCGKEMPADALYCPYCGQDQRKPRSRRANRPHGSGSIVKLPGKRNCPYMARMPAKYSSTAETRVILGYYRTYREADAALAEARQNQHFEKDRLTLAVIYEQFTAGNYYNNLSPAGQNSHRGAWRYLQDYGKVRIREITTAQFQAAVDAMRDRGLKRETMAKVRNLASLLCKECMRQGMMSVNYGALVQLPKQEKTERQPFSPEELKRLWAASDAGDDASASILVMCYTGMRPGELLGIRIEEHIKPGYFLTGSKTDAGRNRIIPIAELIRPLVDRLAAGREEGPLVATPTGINWRVDNWRKRVFNRVMEQLGITGATPYTGRHTYADIQKRRSVDPEIIMEIMGHEDYATTVEHYHTTTAEDIARICQAVSGLERPA